MMRGWLCGEDSPVTVGEWSTDRPKDDLYMRRGLACHSGRVEHRWAEWSEDSCHRWADEWSWAECGGHFGGAEHAVERDAMNRGGDWPGRLSGGDQQAGPSRGVGRPAGGARAALGEGPGRP